MALVSSVGPPRVVAGGLTVEETAAATGVSPATVKREWTMARAWLQRALASRGCFLEILDDSIEDRFFSSRRKFVKIPKIASMGFDILDYLGCPSGNLF